jgi:hypothetical protein
MSRRKISSCSAGDHASGQKIEAVAKPTLLTHSICCQKHDGRGTIREGLVSTKGSFEVESHGRNARFWLSLVTPAVLCLTWVLWTTTEPTVRAGQSRAKAVVTHTRFNFGEVFAGEQLVHVFSIRNEGTAPLTLLDKARDTEGKGNRDDRSPPRIVYARATLPAIRDVSGLAGAPIAREPVPT